MAIVSQQQAQTKPPIAKTATQKVDFALFAIVELLWTDTAVVARV